MFNGFNAMYIHKAHRKNDGLIDLEFGNDLLLYHNPLCADVNFIVNYP